MTEAITQAIIDWQSKKVGADEHFYLVVYDHLRKLASKGRLKVVHRFGDEAIQEHLNSTTSLVHELYIKISQNTEYFDNRADFFFMVSRTIHNILVDQARKSTAQKRDVTTLQIDDKLEEQMTYSIDEDFLTLSESIESLASEYPRHAKVVQLKYFGGLMMKEIADITGSSLSSVEKDMAFARSWLKLKLSA
ncbi:ECF-type sigma factor [Planctobacterium marinum]|uniref:DNA-directed RNA polymerase subunit sigma n=1 Tax=Planctobacterium marinum TaxID=1631968 RepID=A0AA48KQ22_9ALTE|nr:DNA-directed RNA polymerase subunit sigma [Planctobacterium marinum]